MIKKYSITGLDCPNCAKVLELKLAKVEGVKSLKINFLQEVMELEADNIPDAEKKVKKLASKLYPNTKIAEIKSGFAQNEVALEGKITEENNACSSNPEAKKEGITCDCCSCESSKSESKNAKNSSKTFKKYKLSITGLDCPNCAKTLETMLAKRVPEAKNLSINFVKSTLSFECQNYETCYQKLVTLTHQLEPKAVIKSSENSSSKKAFLIDVSVLIVGLIVGVIALFVPMNKVLSLVLYALSALIIGYKTYIKAIRLLLKGVVNENLLVTISVIGATIVGDHMDHGGGMGGHMEGLMVIALYTIGKVIESLALNKSRKSIAELTNLKPDYAVLISNETETKVLPQEVKLGDIILVRAGEKVPIDGIVLEGTAIVDKQSLTGESLPETVRVGEEVLSGSIVSNGVLKIKTTQVYANSTVSKIMNLIESASDKKSKTETIISKVARYYTIGVMILALVVFGIEYLVLGDLSTAIYRGLIFLVVSCPCAFAISVPLSYFSGIGCASKKGILIKGSNYLDVLSKLNLLAFDKTGTLTTGEFVVEKVESNSKGISEEEILYLACLGEQYSLHPLAKSIMKSNTKKLVKVTHVKEVAGEGVYFEYKQNSYFVGRKNKKEHSSTAVGVYCNNKKLGTIYLKDSLKPSAQKLSGSLSSLGVRSVLLSGDNENIVSSVAEELNIKEYHAELLPQDKFTWLEQEKKKPKNVIGFVGDGINDSPSLMLADVGISMGLNGSTASIEASNIVLVDDNPNKVVTAIKVSKFTRKIVWQNIILSALIKVTFLTLGAFGITGMMWAVIADVGVTLMAILNSLRALYYKAKN